MGRNVFIWGQPRRSPKSLGPAHPNLGTPYLYQHLPETTDMVTHVGAFSGSEPRRGKHVAQQLVSVDCTSKRLTERMIACEHLQWKVAYHHVIMILCLFVRVYYYVLLLHISPHCQ